MCGLLGGCYGVRLLVGITAVTVHVHDGGCAPLPFAGIFLCKQISRLHLVRTVQHHIHAKPHKNKYTCHELNHFIRPNAG